MLATVIIIAIIRRLQGTTIQPQLWFLAGASIALAAELLVIQLTAGLHNYIYWTVSFAAQRRLPGFSLILGVYQQTALFWTIYRRHRRVHPPPPQSTLDKNRSHNAPCRTLPLDHRLPLPRRLQRPIRPRRAAPLSLAAPPHPRDCPRPLQSPPAKPPRQPHAHHLSPHHPPSHHPRNLPLTATLGIHLCPLATPDHPASPSSCSKSPPSPNPSPRSSPSLSFSAEASTPRATSA